MQVVSLRKQNISKSVQNLLPVACQPRTSFVYTQLSYIRKRNGQEAEKVV